MKTTYAQGWILNEKLDGVYLHHLPGDTGGGRPWPVVPAPTDPAAWLEQKYEISIPCESWRLVMTEECLRYVSYTFAVQWDSPDHVVTPVNDLLHVAPGTNLQTLEKLISCIRYLNDSRQMKYANHRTVIWTGR